MLLTLSGFTGNGKSSFVKELTSQLSDSEIGFISESDSDRIPDTELALIDSLYDDKASGLFISMMVSSNILKLSSFIREGTIGIIDRSPLDVGTFLVLNGILTLEAAADYVDSVLERIQTDYIVVIFNPLTDENVIRSILSDEYRRRTLGLYGDPEDEKIWPRMLESFRYKQMEFYGILGTIMDDLTKNGVLDLNRVHFVGGPSENPEESSNLIKRIIDKVKKEG